MQDEPFTVGGMLPWTAMNQLSRAPPLRTAAALRKWITESSFDIWIWPTTPGDDIRCFIAMLEDFEDLLARPVHVVASPKLVGLFRRSLETMCHRFASAAICATKQNVHNVDDVGFSVEKKAICPLKDTGEELQIDACFPMDRSAATSLYALGLALRPTLQAFPRTNKEHAHLMADPARVHIFRRKLRALDQGKKRTALNAGP